MSASYGSVHEENGASITTGTKETSPLIARNNGGGGGESSQQQETTSSSTSLSCCWGPIGAWFDFVAYCWTQLVFDWFTPLLYRGNEQKQLNPDDLDLVPFPNDCDTNGIFKTFDQHWQDELKQESPSLVKALIRAFGREFAMAGLLKLVHDACIFVGPQVLNAMIYYLRDADAPMSLGLGLTALVTVSQLCMSFCLRHYFFKCYLSGLKLRTAMVVAVYQKALVLASGERQTRTVGEITNLMSIDASRLQDLTTYLHAIWYTVFQISLALFFLWQQLGPSCLGGVIIMIFMMPVTKSVAKWMGQRQKHVMQAKDARVEINSEVLSNIKVIKLQAWEESFEQKIIKYRAKELSEMWTYYVGTAASTMLWNSTPVAVAVATFAVYVWTGHQLEVASALTALALFDILRFPLFMLPQIVNRIVEAGVSVTRVQSFLLCDEHESIPPGSLDANGIQMDNVTAAYESKKPRLDGVDVDAKTKDLLDTQWEVQLLKSQLEEAEQQIKRLAYQNEHSAEKLALAKQRIVEMNIQESQAAAGKCDRSASDSDDWEAINPSSDPPVENAEFTVSTNVAPASDKQQADPERPQSTNLLCLKRVNFECNEGEFIAVVGSVGSGKSTLINSILGEVKLLAGTSSVRGSLSYFSQSPFIMNATIRDNILFGHVNDEFIDEERYQRALDCCALRHDLTMLSNGDQTEIGERGVTLSGGQKARVALARAVYHNADISLIDDALSAVDAHVAKHLFNQCIVDELLNESKGKKRSVILVTNALQFLNHPRVDKIVVLNDGRVAEQGTYEELASKTNSQFARFLRVIHETRIQHTKKSSVEEISDDDKEKALEGDFIEAEKTDKASRLSITSQSSKAGSPAGIEQDPSTKKTMLMTEESRSLGHVGKEVYLAWCRAAGGYWVPVVLVLVFGATEGINVLSKWWLTYWSSNAQLASQSSMLAMYTWINVFYTFVIFASTVFMTYIGLKASQNFFSLMLESILKAPQSFFDTTPIGRIINRFSKDMYTIDEELIMTLRMYIRNLTQILSTMIVISGVSPTFALCLIPITLFYIKEQAFFTITYRELKRLDSVNRSPLYALLGETVDGVGTIRAFSAQHALIRRLTTFLDIQQHAYFLTCSAQGWLAVRLELIGTLIITFACLCAVVEHTAVNGDEVQAGLFGLAISFSLSITQTLNWSVRMASDFEAQMVAVERVKDYCEIPSEADRHTDVDKSLVASSSTWPRGEIEFQNVKLRYRPELPLVLKGLDIYIPAGSKVGVVGRTGAGKSTLMIALLRLVELDSGKILLDGVDSRTVGLTTLRSKIAVIPQDPVLFSGTVRTNLDPFEEYTDDELNGVLNRVGLYYSSSSSSGLKDEDGRTYSNTSLSSKASHSQVQSLQDMVSEGGINFSVGQRQLLVIARALLCGASIVIMDEATAAVDADTDARIQHVMRSEFINATCIIVAHRLNTIMDSDYILCMDDGRAAEFDKPDALLEKGGLFRDLVEASSNTGMIGE